MMSTACMSCRSFGSCEGGDIDAPRPRVNRRNRQAGKQKSEITAGKGKSQAKLGGLPPGAAFKPAPPTGWTKLKPESGGRGGPRHAHRDDIVEFDHALRLDLFARQHAAKSQTAMAELAQNRPVVLPKARLAR